MVHWINSIDNYEGIEEESGDNLRVDRKDHSHEFSPKRCTCIDALSHALLRRLFFVRKIVYFGFIRRGGGILAFFVAQRPRVYDIDAGCDKGLQDSRYRIWPPLRVHAIVVRTV